MKQGTKTLLWVLGGAVVVGGVGTAIYLASQKSTQGAITGGVQGGASGGLNPPSGGGGGGQMAVPVTQLAPAQLAELSQIMPGGGGVDHTVPFQGW